MIAAIILTGVLFILGNDSPNAWKYGLALVGLALFLLAGIGGDQGKR